jgi:hypothetical protein
MPRRKGKRRQRERTVYYVVQIEAWDWSYSFGLDKTRYRDEPYMEFRHLEIKGKLLRPHRVKADSVEITLLPDVTLKKENRGRDEPRSVGSIHLDRGLLQALLPIPADVLDPVLQMLIAGRTQYVVIDSAPMHYRQALVKHYRIDSVYDPEDLPPDEA